MNIDLDRMLLMALDLLEGLARRESGARPALRQALRDLTERLDQLDQLDQLDRLDEGEQREVSALERTVTSQAGAALARATEEETVPMPSLPPLVGAMLRLGDAASGVRVRAAEEERSSHSLIPTRGPTVVPPPAAVQFSQSSEADFDLMARRCRLKARALRWQNERARLFAGIHEAGTDLIAENDRAMIDEARNEQDCFLWMCRPDYHAIDSDQAFEQAACCYDALAESGTLMAEADRAAAGERTDSVADAMRLLGEAQSALRVIVDRAEVTRADPDQIMAFTWLRRETSSRGVYVQHLQIAAPADPEQHEDLRRRINEARLKLQERKSGAEKRRTLLQKANYHAARLNHGGGDESDWKKIFDVVEELISACDMPPSDRHLRELFLPLMDDLPGIEAGPGTREALAAVDRYRQQLVDNPAAPVARRAESAALIEARRLLAGRSAVLIGGQARELHRRTIESALNLAHLEWVAVQHHQSLEGEVHAALRRSEVSVVITMTRFRSHSFGPQLRAWARDYGKNFVELPGGYGVEQIAHQVIQQAGQELQATS